MGNQAKQFCLVHGLEDTHIRTGEDYDAITWQGIVKTAMAPLAMDKHSADAIIASLYRGHDARDHKAQADKGEFHIIPVDIDSGNHTIDDVDAIVVRIFGDVARLIYATKSSADEDKRWRVFVPVKTAIPGADFIDTQNAVASLLSDHGLTSDKAMSRTGQVSFLPNKGEHYEHKTGKSPILPSVGDINGLTDRIAQIEADNAKAAKEALENAKRNAEARRQREATGELSPIEWFNENNSITAMIADNGWIPMGPGRGFTWWASPYSKSQGRSVRCYESERRCVSFTGSDVGKIGKPTEEFMTYDAFDVFVARQHGGNEDAALRAVLEMMGRDKVKFADVPEYQPESDNPEDYGFEVQHQNVSQKGDLGHIEMPKSEPQKEAPKPYPTPYDMFDEAALPPRRFIYGRYYIRGFCSFLASPGGTGKTALQIVEALSIATGRSLIGEPVYEQTNVWMANLEDPEEEMQRRILAAMKFHKVKPDDVRGKFFMDAGRTLDLKFATQTRDGIVVNEAMVEYMRKRIIDLNIGVVMLDPFVGCHDVQENDNGAQNSVMAVIRKLADETNASIVLVHHTRKMNGGTVDVDSIRGAGSLIGAARSARVVNPLSEQQAADLGIDPQKARGLFQVTDGKNNLTPKATDAILRRFESVTLDNGDFVGVVAEVDAGDAFKDVTDDDARAILRAIAAGYERGDDDAIGYSIDTRANERWAGNVVLQHKFEHLGTVQEPRAKAIMKGWIKAGRFTVEDVFDPKNRNTRKAIVKVDTQVGAIA